MTALLTWKHNLRSGDASVANNVGLCGHGFAVTVPPFGILVTLRSEVNVVARMIVSADGIAV